MSVLTGGSKHFQVISTGMLFEASDLKYLQFAEDFGPRRDSWCALFA